jgi:hypothetical protein
MHRGEKEKEKIKDGGGACVCMYVRGVERVLKKKSIKREVEREGDDL